MKLIFILFLLLLYRIEFMPDTGGGLAKMVQAFALVGIVYCLMKYCPKVFNISFSYTNGAIATCLVLYLYAVVSTLWAYNKVYALSLSAQNVILLLLFVWFFSLFNNFKSVERAFLVSAVVIQLFEMFWLKVSNLVFFDHLLPAASSGALTLTYCLGEYINMKQRDPERLFVLKYAAIISAVVLVLNTSGGANAAAVVGVGVSMFFGGKRIYAILLVLLGLFLLYNRELIDSILLFLMPGKDLNTIEHGNGRDEIWKAIVESVASRPLYGWGYACAERAVDTVIAGQILSDAHNSYVGVYGSLGYIGCALFGVHLLMMLWNIFRYRALPGFVGLFSSFACACTNMYTYGFLSGKACSITMIYFMLVSLTFHFKRSQ